MDLVHSIRHILIVAPFKFNEKTQTFELCIYRNIFIILYQLILVMYQILYNIISAGKSPSTINGLSKTTDLSIVLDGFIQNSLAIFMKIFLVFYSRRIVTTLNYFNDINNKEIYKFDKVCYSKVNVNVNRGFFVYFFSITLVGFAGICNQVLVTKPNFMYNILHIQFLIDLSITNLIALIYVIILYIFYTQACHLKGYQIKIKYTETFQMYNELLGYVHQIDSCTFYIPNGILVFSLCSTISCVYRIVWNSITKVIVYNLNYFVLLLYDLFWVGCYQLALFQIIFVSVKIENVVITFNKLNVGNME